MIFTRRRLCAMLSAWLVFLFTMMSTGAFAKDITVKGQVKDVAGEPLVGVAVVVKGTTTGTVSDFDGNYTIQAPSDGTLAFRYVGYIPQELSVANQTTINVSLKESVSALDEVVVVGYGVVRKRDLVGAVDQVDSKMIGERANMNISSSLQGTMPGLNISMRDGKPSRNATLNLRGTGSIGAGGSALILIDGVECDGDMTTVSPSDVESVSILKDASSAAIYGARGAFGVVLITTKKAGKGRTKVNYSGSVSGHQRLSVPEIVTNGLQFTNGWYTAYTGSKDTGAEPGGINNVFPYSKDWYDELVKRDADPTLERMRVNSQGLYEYFGNTDWDDIVYKDITYSTEHNLSISGGTDKVGYYVSGRYFDQDGIYNKGNENYNQYNLRAKGNIKINKYLTLDNNTDFLRRKIHQPMVMYDHQLIPRQMEQQAYPMTLEKNLDGTWTETAVYTGWAGFCEGTSFQENQKMDFRNTVSLTFTPIKQLVFKADYTYYYNHSERVRAEDMYTYYTGPNISKQRQNYTSLEHYSYVKNYNSANFTANWLPEFTNPDHHLNVLVGWNVEDKDYTAIRTYRRGLIYSTKPSFALMDGDYYATDQNGYSWGYAGLLFRANYNYLDRYLVEISGRYDSSSKFPRSGNQQWGFFPSTSLAWRASEEGFMEGTRSWLDNLKVRASVGSLGNGNVDPYKFLSLMNVNKTSAVIGDGLQSYVDVPSLIPSGLTWERSTTYDVGLDFDLFNNRLNFIGDYYHRYTTDMYTVGPDLPNVLGATVPKGNNASMKTKGWEVSLTWRDGFTLGHKPFNYSVKGMLWDSRSWVTKFYNPTNKLSTYYEGMEIGEMWGYHIEGLFADQEDIDNHANQSKIKVSDTNILKPGDLKFADLDGSGVIDNGNNTLDDHGDLKKIGNTTPRFCYGINLSANWNGIGLSAFFQGVGKKNWYPARETAYFWGQYNRPYSFMLKQHTGDNVWTEENQNVNAYWPRYRGYLATGANKVMGSYNDRYLQNVGYLRLKNVQLDYTFNKSICQALHLEKLRVFLSGENLLTWSKLFKVTKNFDPEGINAGDSDFRSTTNTDGEGYGYPMMRSYTFGINVTF